MKRAYLVVLSVLSLAPYAQADLAVKLVGQWICEPGGTAVSGSLAYVGVGTSLYVVDVSMPSAPRCLSSVTLPGNVVAVDAPYGCACAAIGESGVQVIDVYDPCSPVLGGVCDPPPPSWTYRVAVSGTMAYVSDINRGLLLVDVLMPDAPSLVSTYPTAEYPRDIVISGDYALLAVGSAGLQIMDVYDSRFPAPVGWCDTPGSASGLAVPGGRYVYVADGVAGLQVIDASDPRSPILVGGCNTPGDAASVAVSARYAYVADMDAGLQIIDIHDPCSPTLVGRYDTPGITYDVAVSGKYIYTSDTSGGLVILQVAWPGDFEPDCDVDWDDVAFFASRWMSAGCRYPDYCDGADFSYDGSVNSADFAAMSRHWLRPGCP